MLSGPPLNGFAIEDPELDAEFQALRWFPLPSEVAVSAECP